MRVGSRGIALASYHFIVCETYVHKMVTCSTILTMVFFCAIMVAGGNIMSAKKGFKLAVEATPVAEIAGLKIIVNMVERRNERHGTLCEI